MLGIINNSTKEFRIEGTYSRDAITLEKFITKFVKKGNNIISDGWEDYQFLDSPNSGYSHIIKNHSFGSFGYGLESTSHIEAIWNILKSKIKTIYHVIPYKNLMRFAKEAEFKYIIEIKAIMKK